MIPVRTVTSAAIAGVIVSGIAWLLPWALSFAWLAALLILTAGIYVGIAIVDGRPVAVWLEAGQAVVLGAFVVAAWAVHPVFLAAGWLVHPLWDLFHRHPTPANTPPVVISWCLVFDVIVGLSTLIQAFVVWSA